MVKAFVFLATVYGANGPDVYVLDSGISGQDCVAHMESGITEADYRAVVDNAAMRQKPAPDMFGAVLSCEFDMGDD
jgi:hypothetical protein